MNMQIDDEYSYLLGRSLVAARTANQMTQQELALVSGVSRATIAEIESGKGDPRLSNIVALARALRTSPMMLLLEKGALTREVAGHLQERTDTLNVPLESIEKMKSYLNSTSRSGPQYAAREGIRALGAGGGAGVGAAIGSVLLPGIGTAIGAALGGLLGEWSAANVKTDSSEDPPAQCTNQDEP
jgi:transcriptional regulator with XRE-family HTH domain